MIHAAIRRRYRGIGVRLRYISARTFTRARPLADKKSAFRKTRGNVTAFIFHDVSPQIIVIFIIIIPCYIRIFVFNYYYYYYIHIHLRGSGRSTCRQTSPTAFLIEKSRTRRELPSSVSQREMKSGRDTVCESIIQTHGALDL
jgi:hypothetical protein